MSTDRAALTEAIERLRKRGLADPDQLALVCDAAEAWADTLPKTKMVEVWRVEFAQVKSQTLATWEAASAAFSTRAEAHQYAQIVTGWSCTAHIKITGPHQQEIPA